MSNIEQKKSTIVNIQQNGSYQSKFDNSLIYKYEIEFENGDIGDYHSKSENQTKFVKGQDSDYMLERNQYGIKIKPVNNFVPQSNQSTYSNKKDDVQHYIINQSSMDRAVTLAVGRGEFDLEVIKRDAERISNWVVTYKPETDLPF